MYGIPFYGRFSSYYFLYYALLGVLVPYWALFLQLRGFNAAEIGMLRAIPHLTKLGAPNLWGWLADKTGQRLRIIRLGNFVAALVFPFVFMSYGFWSMVLVLVGFSFFWNAVMAQCEALVLETLGSQSHKYSLVRLWGSIGFVVTVLVLGFLIEYQGAVVVAWAMAILLFVLWLASMWLPAISSTASDTITNKQAASFWQVFRHLSVLAFFISGLLMQLSHGPYYAFYTLHLNALGVPSQWIGVLWSFGVIAEIVLFVFMSRLLLRFTIKQLLVASLLLTVIRWGIIGSGTTAMGLLLFAQCLHAASFASYHASSMAWLHEFFPARLAGQGQAVYASFSLGAGWALGAVISGVLWEEWGVMVFNMAAGAALLAAVILYWFLPHSKNEAEKKLS